MSNISDKSKSGPINPFDPEALEELETTSNPTNEVLDEETRIEHLLEETSEKTGVDLEESFDMVKMDDSLPRGVPAATSHRGYRIPGMGDVYGRTDLHVSPQLFELNENEQRHVMAHEGVHGLYFENNLTRELDGALSGEVLGELHRKMKYGNEQELEGATELIARHLNPESVSVGEKFRRNETRQVQKDLDSELLDEINGLKKDLVDDYREVYNVEIENGLYVETGNFAGQDYIAVVQGEDVLEGSETVSDYLENISYPQVENNYTLEDDNYLGLDDYEPLDGELEDPVESALEENDFGEMP